MVSKQPDESFHIVAIGASAGGLEALQLFLSNLPAELTSCSFIIAQHLSPSHKSRLTEILSRETKLDVTEALDGTKLLPGKVYITPPDKDISVIKGRISLTKPASEIGPKPNVNVLFKSLANKSAEKVIGIILSGTGSDGAEGSKQLKNTGGFIIAQDPKTARYDGMPGAAIQMGDLDAVLSPEQMGDEILEYINDPDLVRQQKDLERNEGNSLKRVLELLSKRTGTDFSNYKSATIGRRLQKRLGMLKINTLEEYLGYLEKQPEELDEMFKMILIGVTSFFRDKEAFNALEAALKGLIAQKTTKDGIRIWVPGCSTGEEAYSIAILLCKLLGEDAGDYNIQIFATDINEKALQIGRKGVYSEDALSKVPKKLVDTYFIKSGSEYELAKHIKQMVLFSRHDIASNPPFLKLDLISCRNLLIYFGAALQQQIFPIFHYALNPDGILFLGKSETIGKFSDLFSTVNDKNRLFKRKRTKNLKPVRFSAFKARIQPLSTNRMKDEDINLSLNDLVKETLFNTYEHPYVVIDEEYTIHETWGDVRLFLSLPSGSMQANLLKMVNSELQIEVRSVVSKAVKNRIATKSSIRKFELYEKEYYVRITAKPLIYSENSEELFLVIFEQLDIGQFVPGRPSDDALTTENVRLEELERELAITRQQLQTYIEQIETSNEELQSLNEELQSTNEELQSSNEELETTNEELQSTNEEVQIAYTELKQAHGELENKEEQLRRVDLHQKALLNNNLLALFLIDQSFQVIATNDVAKELTKKLTGRDIRPGESIINLTSESNLQGFIEGIRKAFDGENFTGERKETDKSGVDRWFAFNITAVADSKPVEVVSVGLLDITAEKEISSRLNTSERLLHTIFDTTTGGMCITDEKGTFVDVNKEYCRIYGYEREELIGENFTKVVPPEYREQLQKLHDEFIAGKEELDAEWTVEKKNGSRIDIFATAKLLEYGDGRRYKVTSIKDLTENKKYVNLLEETQTATNVGGWDLDTITYELNWSDEVYNIFELSKETEINLNLMLSHFMQEAGVALNDAIEAAISDGLPFDFELECVTSGSHSKWVRFTCRPIQVNKKTVKLFGTVQDITNGKDAAKKIFAEQERYRSVFENSLAALFITDRDGNILEANKIAESMFGYSLKEFGKINSGKLIDKGASKLNKLLKEREESGKAAGELVAVKKNGEKFYCDFASASFRDEQGCILNSVMMVDITERKIAEQRLKATTNNLPGVVFRYVLLPDKTDRLEYVSEGATEVWGFSPEEVMSDIGNVWNRVHPDDRELVFQSVIESAENLTPWTKEWRYNHPDGSVLWHRGSGNPVQLNDGSIAWDTILLDVTSENSAKIQLQENEEELSLIFDTIGDIIFTLAVENDNEFRFLRVNEQFLKTNGKESEEVIGKRLEEVIPEENIDFVINNYQKAISLGESYRWEETVHLKTGVKTGLVSVTPLFDENGKCFQLVGSISDITERKALENELQQVLNQSLDVICTINSDGEFVKVSDASKQVWGYSPQEMEGKYFQDFVVEEDKEKTAAAALKIMAGFDVSDFENRYVKKDGSVVEIFWSARWVESDQLMYCVGKDATELKKAVFEEQKRYETLFLELPAYICVLEGKDHVYKMVNREYEKLIGKSNIIGKTVKEVVPEIEGQETIKLLDRAFTTGEIVEENEIEVELVRDDGSIDVRYLNFAFIPDKNKDGEVTGLFTFGVDITGQVASRRDIEESNKRYELVTRATSDAVWDFEPAKEKLYWGEGFKTLFGYDKERFEPGMDKWIGKIHPDDIKQINEGVEKIFHGSLNLWDKEYRFRKADGTYAFVRDNAIVVRDSSGKPQRVIGAMEDITARKEEEQRLKLMESVVTNTNDIVMITKAEPLDAPHGPEVLYVNEAFDKITGYKPEEIIGKTPRTLQGPDSNFTALKEFGEKIRRWEPAEVETINYKKNGEEFWVELTVNPISNEKGWYTHWISIERDITQRKIRELQQGLEAEISEAFNRKETLTQSLEAALQGLTTLGKFELGEVWLADRNNQLLELSAKYVSDEVAGFYEAETTHSKIFKINEGLQGKVWKKKEVIFWKNIHKRKSFVRRSAALKTGLRTAYGFPLIYQEKLIGVVLLATKKELSKKRFYTPILQAGCKKLAAELERKRLEEELSRIFESAPDIICIAGFDGYFKKINPAAIALLGYTEEELLSTKIVDFIHPDDREKTVREFENKNEKSSNQYFENRYISKMGEVVWLSWTSKPFYEEGISYSIAKDITEEKQLEILLEQASKLSRIGSWELDFIQNRPFWSEVTLQIMEADGIPQPTIEEMFSRHVESSSKDLFFGVLQDAMNHGTSWDVELRVNTFLGNKKWVRSIGEAEFVNGKCLRLYGSLQDINKRKIAEENLVKKSRHIQAIARLNSALINYKNWFNALSDNLEVIGEAVGADRVYYFENYFDNETGKNYSTQKLEWCRDGIEPQIDNEDLMGMEFGEYPRLFNNLIQGKPNTETLSSLSDDVTLKQIFESQQIKAFLAIPIFVKGNFHGLVGFDNCTEEQYWSKDEVQLLETITSNLAIAIERANADDLLEELFREKNTILESISDAFYAIDRNWIITYFNSEARRLLEKPSEDVIGKSLWEVFPPSKETELYTIFEKIIDDNHSVSFEYYYPPQSMWYEVSAYPSDSGISVYFKNIHERKESQKNILEKTRQLDAIASFNSMLIKEGSWLEALNNSLKLFGEVAGADRAYFFESTHDEKSGEEAISMKCEWAKGEVTAELENPDHQNVPVDFIGEFIDPLHANEAYSSIVAHIKDEPFKEFLQSQEIKSLLAVPVFASGLFKGFIGFDDCKDEREWSHEDISFLRTIALNLASAIENREAEIAIQQAFEEKNQILESIGDGFFALNRKYEIEYWNNQAEELLLVRKEKVLGNYLWDVFDKESAPYSYQMYRTALEEHKALKFEDYFAPIDRWFDVNVYPSENGISVFFKDITERRRAEERLQELNKTLEMQAKELAESNAELEQFAFVASHDLQEPLRMITGFLAQIEKKYDHLLDERGKKYIYFATDGAKRMRQIIMDLLEYSRVGRIDTDKTEVDLNDVLEDVCALNKKLISDKNAEVNWENLPVVNASKSQMQQLFRNLVNNALNYQKPGNKPIVRIEAEETKKSWIFSVKDNGIGIDSQYYDKIFNIFQRLHGREEYSGTGVGLAICKKIVDDQGGEIWVESEVGKGTTFKIKLPKTKG